MVTRKLPLFGIGVYPEANDPQQAFRLAELADAHSVDFVSIVDHPYRPIFLESWTILTALGVKTQRVRLHTNVLCLPLHVPSVLAKAAVSLDILTDGRVEFGLGAGGYWENISAFGGPYRQPAEAVEALEEAIDITRLVWGQKSQPGEPVSYKGKYYQLQNALPGPAPAHDMGIWIGSVGPRMSRLIGRKADGWVVSNIFRPFEEALPLQNIIDESALKAGRDPSTITRWYNLWGVIKKPGQSIVNLSRPNAPVHTVDEWVEEIVRYYHDLRMDVFCFWNTETDREQQNRLFIEEVIPAVYAALSKKEDPINNTVLQG